jgi:hypothetical protein
MVDCMHADAKAFTIQLSRHDGHTLTVPWSDVDKIVAFKQDLFNPNIILLEMTTKDGSYEIVEDDCGGYEALMRVLRERLRNVTSYDSWWIRVTNPLSYHEEVLIYDSSVTEKPK